MGTRILGRRRMDGRGFFGFELSAEPFTLFNLLANSLLSSLCESLDAPVIDPRGVGMGVNLPSATSPHSPSNRPVVSFDYKIYRLFFFGD